MNNNDPLTLRSIELRNPILHSCRVIQILEEGGGPAKLLVEIDPPAACAPYGREGTLSRMVLAPRHRGVTLAPQISEWPCHVHMCAPKPGGTWTEGPFDSLDWGLLERAQPTGA